MPVDIHRWRLDINKSMRFKDCRSSPNGKLIAYWSDKVIMVFDRATTISRTNSSSTSDNGTRTLSMESARDRTLRNVGQHQLAGVSCSWKSLGMTNSYLVAATTETKSLNVSLDHQGDLDENSMANAVCQCYLFDIESDQTLQTYSKVTLPHPGLHNLAVSPNQHSMACILSNNGRASLLTAVIETSLSEPTTPSAR
jgi:hypothetical protein